MDCTLPGRAPAPRVRAVVDRVARLGGVELHRSDFDRTRDHWWWRPGWGPGTRYLTFHLTFEDAPALHAAAARMGEALQGLRSVDVVPIPWLHLTMTGVGFAHDVSQITAADLVERVFSAARTLDVTPLRFDRLSLVREALALKADSGGWIGELNGIQVEAIQDVCGVDLGEVAFHPHVSLAYFSGEVDEPGLVRAVEAVGLHDVAIARPRLSLLELGRDDRVYTWRVVAQQPL